VWRHARDSGPRARGGKPLLNVVDALTVDVQSGLDRSRVSSRAADAARAAAGSE
jgi:hypothetical protein